MEDYRSNKDVNTKRTVVTNPKESADFSHILKSLDQLLIDGQVRFTAEQSRLQGVVLQSEIACEDGCAGKGRD